MTLKVDKSDAKGGKFLYINISGFNNKVHRQVIFEKIQKLLKEANTKVRVY